MVGLSSASRMVLLITVQNSKPGRQALLWFLDWLVFDLEASADARVAIFRLFLGLVLILFIAADRGCAGVGWNGRMMNEASHHAAKQSFFVLPLGTSSHCRRAGLGDGAVHCGQLCLGFSNPIGERVIDNDLGVPDGAFLVLTLAERVGQVIKDIRHLRKVRVLLRQVAIAV